MIKYRKVILLIICCAIFSICLCDRAYAEIETPAIFNFFAEKTTSFARQLRSLAFAISGFGIIMFTFLAICGKINFRHLGYIMISLFFLSGVGLLISYMTGGAAAKNLHFDQLYGDSLAIQNAGKGKLPAAHRHSG